MDTARSILIILVVVVSVCILSLVGTKEYYGGKVKKITKIPFNDCVRICKTYLSACLEDNKYADPGGCYRRFGTGGTCETECVYSNYQRQ